MEPRKKLILWGIVMAILWITILALVVDTVFFEEEEQSGYPVPKGRLSSSGSEQGWYLMWIEEQDRSCSISRTAYNITDREGVSVESGTVWDIFGLNPEFPGTNISFTDADEDRRMSAGDFFLVRGNGNNGTSGPGYTFTITYTFTDEVMMQVTTYDPDAVPEEREDEFPDYGMLAIVAFVIVTCAGGAVSWMRKRQHRNTD